MSLCYSIHEVFSSQPNSFLHNCAADSRLTLIFCLFSIIQPPSQETQLFTQLVWDPCYIASGRTEQKKPFPSLQLKNTSIVAYVFFAAETCLPSRCLAMNVYSGSTVPAFRRHVTILTYCCYTQAV
jgi:hypothetical protein